MTPESLPPLRCEIHRAPTQLGWLKWSLPAVILAGGMLDALWLIPAQRDAVRRCHRIERRAEPAAPTPAPRATRVDGVLLLAPR